MTMTRHLLHSKGDRSLLLMAVHYIKFQSLQVFMNKGE